MTNSKTITKKFRLLPDGQPFTVKGREAWSLLHLIKAGARGCSALDYPAVRWAAYVHDLRHDFGIRIETEHESHGGPFPGSHARYRLVSECVCLDDEREAA
jgi:hypothetical protein